MTTLARLRSWLLRPTAALPLDIFRIAVGLLSLAYFIRTLAETADISSPNGLIDHAFSARVLWFTRIGLFQPGISASALQAIFAGACVLALFVTIGFRVKLSAAALYLIAVSTYRWNYLVTYVDDSIVHLLLFWILLLPVGRTLILYPPFLNRAGIWREWVRQEVPGVTLRCLLWNVTLLYAVAGFWKWSSPMWRSGAALLAILQLPIAYAPDFWGPDQVTLLRVMNYWALVLECAFPLLLLLPLNRWLRYGLLASLVAFHGGIIGTLRIPFANLACLALIPLLLRSEIMRWARRGESAPVPVASATSLGSSGWTAVLFVTTLTLAMASSVTMPNWRAASRPGNSNPAITSAVRPNSVVEGLGPVQFVFYSALWTVGMAQQYQLFNWIDDRNYHIEYEAYRSDLQPVNVEEIFPRAIRSILLQAYLFGISWAQIPVAEQAGLRRTLYTRFARRYCRPRHRDGDEVLVYAKVRRVTAANPMSGPVDRSLMMRFRCEPDETRLLTVNLVP